MSAWEALCGVPAPRQALDIRRALPIPESIPEALADQRPSLTERALEHVIVRLLSAFCDVSKDTEYLHSSITRARLHIIRRMERRKQSRRALKRGERDRRRAS